MIKSKKETNIIRKEREAQQQLRQYNYNAQFRYLSGLRGTETEKYVGLKS
jgi:hypothetical protein